MSTNQTPSVFDQMRSTINEIKTLTQVIMATYPTQQQKRLAKKRRNQRTRLQYKKKKAQRVTIVQEIEQSHSQEVEQIGVK